MNRTLIEAAAALADTLARENAALAALDLGAAAALLAEKRAATDTFVRAQAEPSGPPDAEQRRLAERLCRLAEDNRRLLERGIRVQGRVLGLVTKALPKPPAPRYGASGAMARAAMAPMMMSARV